MGIIGDVQKALESIPIWKRLKKLPERTDDIERRLAALEEKLSGPVSKDACPSCGERTWFVKESKKDDIFGKLGGARRVYECKSCGHSEETLD